MSNLLCSNCYFYPEFDESSTELCYSCYAHMVLDKFMINGTLHRDENHTEAYDICEYDEGE